MHRFSKSALPVQIGENLGSDEGSCRVSIFHQVLLRYGDRQCETWANVSWGAWEC